MTTNLLFPFSTSRHDTSPSKDVSHALTGYSSDEVIKLGISLKGLTLDVFCALAMLHLNLTHEQEATVHISYVGGALFITPYTTTPYGKTFVQPMYRRGSSELHNAKEAAKNWTFQILLMMDGCPLV